MDLLALRPQAWLLAGGVLLDLVLGDPEYAGHPVRLLGWSLARIENGLRHAGCDGFGGGTLLFGSLCAIWVVALSVLVAWLPHAAAEFVALFLIYSLLALRDLADHVRRVERAAADGNLDAARTAVSTLVGRDTDAMDAAACRRAAIESLAENLTDGYISPIFWYVIGGLPGLLLFKVVSTMDSMVGYKTPPYLRFGRVGARADDVMNWLPARLTWLLVALVAAIAPGYSGRKSLVVGWRQHGAVPGPNAGWSEAALAGALGRRLVGPIVTGGAMVTDLWLGEATDAPAGTGRDVKRALDLSIATGLVFAALGVIGLIALV